MKITVFAFATASDALGKSELQVELPPGTSISELETLLKARHPALESLWPRLAIAVDGEILNDDRVLEDGSEVALLPPVSGGQDEPKTRVSTLPIDADVLSQLVAGPTRGAVVLFLGAVRNHHESRGVTALTYTAYQSMAEKVLNRLVVELEASFEGGRLAIHHRIGQLFPGTPSVGIATASPHRQAAYEMSRLALERLKREVPIWKREHYDDGAQLWREEESLRLPIAKPETIGSQEESL